MEVTLKLSPYKIQSVETVASQIPTGVLDIKAPIFWMRGYRGQGVTIAVIDTGCQIDHPDLKERIIGGRNFTEEDEGNPDKYNDYNGHGTHVAGIIAAQGKDQGILGVAPEANLLIVKGMNKSGEGTCDKIMSAMEYAIEQKVNIISLSIGTRKASRPLHDMIKKAVNENILVVCAASNEGDGDPNTSECSFPACYPEVISVGAQVDMRVASFSNTNDQIDLIAPGVNIMSTYINGKYATMSGTSMAAPHVTGALALLINWGQDYFGRNLLEVEVYAQLIKRTISLGLPKTEEGNGMLHLTSPEILESLIKRKKI